mmetsp:Transcript_31794/g.74364  ORF Transcript_31794/g.74364 Transcript_31794/m.74364 type:complete len:251 (+) Transcript_31794:332-1084(+)|eukprot:CAMPEP_0114127288 /NCGR_PEP_ID=MMETSP0043_2-20121206/10292_1 /TAXON_ID=464988 /ORGANISM="Hemiselmis andersenii, Strain CCMP644" /LENGTH=250 /DNA_ID=CAMNT_0001220347 /DNA_START=188 /DNA_END=940 /DNA_ORIENTATION=+
MPDCLSSTYHSFLTLPAAFLIALEAFLAFSRKLPGSTLVLATATSTLPPHFGDETGTIDGDFFSCCALTEVGDLPNLGVVTPPVGVTAPDMTPPGEKGAASSSALESDGVRKVLLPVDVNFAGTVGTFLLDGVSSPSVGGAGLSPGLSEANMFTCPGPSNDLMCAFVVEVCAISRADMPELDKAGGGTAMPGAAAGERATGVGRWLTAAAPKEGSLWKVAFAAPSRLLQHLTALTTSSHQFSRTPFAIGP